MELLVMEVVMALTVVVILVILYYMFTLKEVANTPYIGSERDNVDTDAVKRELRTKVNQMYTEDKYLYPAKVLLRFKFDNGECVEWSGSYNHISNRALRDLSHWLLKQYYTVAVTHRQSYSNGTLHIEYYLPSVTSAAISRIHMIWDEALMSCTTSQLEGLPSCAG